MFAESTTVVIPQGLLDVLQRAGADAGADSRGTTLQRHRSFERWIRPSAAGLAYLMAEVWLEMVFRYGTFHADPQSGPTGS